MAEPIRPASSQRASDWDYRDRENVDTKGHGKFHDLHNVQEEVICVQLDRGKRSRRKQAGSLTWANQPLGDVSGEICAVANPWVGPAQLSYKSWREFMWSRTRFLRRLACSPQRPR